MKGQGFNVPQLKKSRFSSKKSFISRIENGKTDIQLSTLYRLLEFGLGKNVEVSVN